MKEGLKMSIFSKKTTVAMMLYLFEDEKHPSPGKSSVEQNKFAAKILPEVIKKHYLDALKPPAKWNYYFSFLDNDGNEFRKDFGPHDFRDPKTNALSRQKQFFDLCDQLKMIWFENLGRDNPKYDRKKLLSASQESEYDWFPEYGLVVISALLPGYVKSGTEKFKDTKW